MIRLIRNNIDKVVANSIDSRGETGIITGSNMSGKTTFLRTLGINVVLAYAGAPVRAKSLGLSEGKAHTILLVSTHDFELCDLVEEKNMNGKNYHFEEYYQENQIYFDYKIKSGRGLTTNAKYILKMAGLI